MSKKEFIIKKTRNINQALDSDKIPEKTKEILEEVFKNPDIKAFSQVMQTIKNDSSIATKDKQSIILGLEEAINIYENYENLPDDYQNLKNEALFFSTLSQKTFVLMAHRLKKIRDLELYKEDGYKDFKSFISQEIQMNRQTVYKYIAVFEYFGVSLTRHQNLSLLNLYEALPLLKSTEGSEQQNLKEEIIQLALNLTQKELREKVQEFKSQQPDGRKFIKKNTYHVVKEYLLKKDLESFIKELLLIKSIKKEEYLKLEELRKKL